MKYILILSVLFTMLLSIGLINAWGVVVDIESNYSCSGSTPTDCSNAFDENFGTYSRDTTANSGLVYYYENVTIPTIYPVDFANWTYSIYRSGTGNTLLYCFNHSSGSWVLLRSLTYSETTNGMYPSFTQEIPDGCLNGTDLKMNTTIYSTSYTAYYYEGRANFFNESNYIIFNASYNSETTEETGESFYLNFTYNDNVFTQLNAYLYYNNTIYNSTITGDGDYSLISNSLTTPPISSITNITFYWILNFTNASGVFSINSTSYNQTITNTILKHCDATYNTTYINFSVRDLNTSNFLNSSFKITFNYEGSNYSYQDTSETNFSFPFCFSPTDKGYVIDASIDYIATGYAQNYYYLNQLNVTNVTTNITLYLSPDSLVDPIQLIVRDDGQNNIPNVYIQIQKYDAGTDTYYTVAMARTDFNGQDIVHLDYYDTFYRYILSEDNEVILMSGISKIYESPIYFIINRLVTLDYNKFQDVTYSLTFNEETGNFILTYSLPSGDVTGICLDVVKRTFKNDTRVCLTCETSSSATIYCNINSFGNGTYVGTVYGIGSYGVIDVLTILKNVGNQIYGVIGNDDGSIYAFLFAGIIVAMFAVSPALAIVGILLGVIGAIAIGFQPLTTNDYAALIGLIIGGITLIVIIKR